MPIVRMNIVCQDIHVGILQYNMVYAPHTYVFHPKQFGDHGSVRDKNAASFLR